MIPKIPEMGSYKDLYPLYRAFVVIPSLVANTLVMSCACVLAGACKGGKAANAVAVLWARLCCAVIPLQVRIHGREYYNTSHNYVVISNHQSMADIPVIQGFLGLRMKWVMKKELKEIPVFGPACKKLGCIFIDRNNRKAAIESMHTGMNRLMASDSVFFFPEGTRSENGHVLPFKKGAFFFAAQANLPILPVTIVNTFHILPKGSLRVNSGIVDIFVHPPLYISPEARKPMEEMIEDVRHTIMNSL